MNITLDKNNTLFPVFWYFLIFTFKPQRKNEYAMVLEDDKASVEYKRNFNGFDFKISSNYTIMSQIPDYGTNIEVSSKF